MCFWHVLTYCYRIEWLSCVVFKRCLLWRTARIYIHLSVPQPNKPYLYQKTQAESRNSELQKTTEQEFAAAISYGKQKKYIWNVKVGAWGSISFFGKLISSKSLVFQRFAVRLRFWNHRNQSLRLIAIAELTDKSKCLHSGRHPHKSHAQCFSW